MEPSGYIAIAVVIFACVVGIAVVSAYFQKRTLSKLAGTTIPELAEGLDISKRYDIVYSGGDFGNEFTDRLQGVRIVGYVGKDDDAAVDKMYMRSRWLVVEFSDGRKAYLMPRAIISL